jgi:hypothetical protein
MRGEPRGVKALRVDHGGSYRCLASDLLLCGNVSRLTGLGSDSRVGHRRLATARKRCILVMGLIQRDISANRRPSTPSGGATF